jgi:hypothetical protein
MQCAKCGSHNPAGKKFCGDCGGRAWELVPKVCFKIFTSHSDGGVTHNTARA